MKMLIKCSGILGILSSIFFVVGFVMHPVGETSQYMLEAAWVPSHVLLFLSSTLGILGFTGLYLSQSEKTKLVGFVGFILLFAGLSLLAGVTYFATVYAPVVAAQAPSIIDNMSMDSSPVLLELVSIVLFSLGAIVFGFASMQAKVFQKWPSVLLSLGGLVIFVGFILVPGILALIGVLLFSVGGFLLGLELWKK